MNSAELEVEALLSGLWLSLSRAVDNVPGSVIVDPIEDGYRVSFKLTGRIQKKMVAPFKNYIKLFAEEEGWTVKKLRTHPTYFTFEVVK
jgi:hypothetical protein